MLKSSGMHMILPHSVEEEAEIQSSEMIFAQGNAVAGRGNAGIISSSADQAAASRPHWGGQVQVIPTDTRVLSPPFLIVYYSPTHYVCRAASESYKSGISWER